MAEKKCPECPEEGLPSWMGTFADMMTLLMCFFVLLFAMSSLDPVKIQMMQESANKRLGINQSSPQIKKRPIDNKLNIQRKLENIVKDLEIDEQAKIVSDPRGMAIEFDGSVCFGSGSTSLKPEIKRILDRVIDDLNHPRDIRPILVEGHSDNQDPEEGTALWKKYPTNWHLSTARAGQVTQYLIKQGVKPGRLISAGYADQWPAKASFALRRLGKIDQTYIDQANVTGLDQEANRRIKIVFQTKVF